MKLTRFIAITLSLALILCGCESIFPATESIESPSTGNAEVQNLKDELEVLKGQLDEMKRQNETPALEVSPEPSPSPTFPASTSTITETIIPINTPEQVGEAANSIDNLYKLSEAQNMLWDIIQSLGQDKSIKCGLYIVKAIRKENSSQYTLSTAEVEWLTGDQAAAAAMLEKGLSEEEARELSFYIAYKNDIEELYLVNANTNILTYRYNSNFLTKDNAANFLKDEESENTGFGLYDIYTKNNNVVFMIQRYMP